jgi:hypothetical protein
METDVIIGNTSTNIIDENPERLSMVITNLSDEIIYISHGSLAIMDTDLFIGPGDSYEMGGDYTSQITGICGSGNKLVRVIENS